MAGHIWTWVLGAIIAMSFITSAANVDALPVHAESHASTYLALAAHHDDTAPSQHCHTAGEACCMHALTCCISLTTIPLPAIPLSDCGIATFSPQIRTPVLFVPRLPPRAV